MEDLKTLIESKRGDVARFMSQAIREFVTAARYLVAAIVLLLVPVSCASILPALPKIVSVLSDASAVLQIVDTAAQEFFRTHPDIPPETRARYVDLYSKTVSSLNGANHALRGVQDVDQEQYDAAFKEFRAAYADLSVFLKDEGIMTGSGLKASPEGGEIDLPEPLALTYRVD